MRMFCAFSARRARGLSSGQQLGGEDDTPSVGLAGDALMSRGNPVSSQSMKRAKQKRRAMRWAFGRADGTLFAVCHSLWDSAVVSANRELALELSFRFWPAHWIRDGVVSPFVSGGNHSVAPGKGSSGCNAL